MSGTKNGLVHPGARSALTSVLLLLRLVPAREVCKRIIKQETTTDDVLILTTLSRMLEIRMRNSVRVWARRRGEESGKVSARVLVEVPVAGGTPGRTQVVLQGSRRVTQLQVTKLSLHCIVNITTMKAPFVGDNSDKFASTVHWMISFLQHRIQFQRFDSTAIFQPF